MTSFRLFLFPPRIPSDVAPLQLYPVYFSGMTQPVEDGDGGINLQTFEEDEAGIFSLIDPYLGMGTDDKIDVFWNDKVIHNIEVKAEQVNNRLFFYLPKTEIVPGFATCHYQVTRAGESSPDEPSAVLTLLIKLNRPAGDDESQHLPWHSHLDIVGLPQDVIDNGVTAPWADKGVPMTIKHYRDIRVNDVIWVRWGGIFLLPPHVVTQAEADGTQDIVITATPNDIKTAGDNAALVIRYEVHDEVWNFSEDWSKPTTVSVDSGAVRLGAPIFQDAINGELHLEELDHQATPLLIKVETNEGFAAGDTLVIKVTGIGGVGTAPRTLSEEVIVGNPPYIHEFPIPFVFASLFARGSLDGSYELRKKDGSDPLFSRRTFVDVIGDPAQLPAPTIDEVVGAILPADSKTASVRIAYPSLKVGDTVNMIWQGTESDGTPYLHQECYDIGDYDQQTGFTYLYVITQHIIALNNGSLKLRYRVYNDDPADYGLSESDFLRVEVSALPATLPAPDVEEAIGGVIDPSQVYSQAHVLIKPVNWVKGDILTYNWIGIAGIGTTKGNVPITSLSIDKPVRFRVDSRYVTANTGNIIKVIYTLLHLATGKFSYSAALQVLVGELQPELKPVVLGEKDGLLDPKELPDGVSKLTIPQSLILPTKPRDVVTYSWIGAVSGKTEGSIVVDASSAGKELVFALDEAFVATHIETNSGKKIAVTYRIWRAEPNITNDSYPLEFEVLKEFLTPAKVLEAQDDVLDPADAPATVHIEPNRPENVGDHFYLNWATTDGVTIHTDHRLITGSSKGKPVQFSVSPELVLECLNKTVKVDYRVELFEGREAEGEQYSLRVERQLSDLPKAIIAEAKGAQADQIDPDDVFPLGATVVIRASAQLKTDDEVTVTVKGKTTVSYPHRISSSEADKELRVIKVAHAFILNQLDSKIDLTYTIKRNVGGTDGPATSSVYDIRYILASGKLRVMGARYNRSTYRASSASRVLSAFNATTNQTIEVQWKYPADMQWTRATTWRDSQPQEPLQVRSADDRLTLNPANIMGNGIDTTINGLAAFVAHGDRGDVIGWGNANYGASIPSPIGVLVDIVEVSCTRSAYAARRADASVEVWGTSNEGGNMAGTSPTDFAQVVGNSTAFAGIKLNGSVVAWGSPNDGATVPGAIGSHRDIRQLFAAGQAFAAIRATGQIVAWGRPGNGGTVPSNIGDLTDIKTVIGSFGAFAALSESGRIVGWGHASFGGTVTPAVSELIDVTELSCANAQAFTARRATGQIVAWGTASYGGVVPQDIRDLSDIVEVCSTWRAFAARRATGHVVAWGMTAEGGSIPGHIKSMNDIVQVCGSSTAFAALRTGGTVVAWGDPVSGGTTQPVAAQLINVVALYNNTHGFCALTSDGRVVTWGQPSGGGDSSAVQHLLQGNVSHQVTAPNADLHAELQHPSIDEAPENVLDPASLPSEGATVRVKAYVPMLFRDKVTLYFFDKEIDYVPVGQSAVGKDVTFIVPAQLLIDNALEDSLLVRYEVQFEGVGEPQRSLNMTLQLKASFEAEALLDLSGLNYVVAVEKPPLQIPDYARLTRIAEWGTAPHTYQSSDPTIASIGNKDGEVIGRRNGQCVISATDSGNPPRTERFSITIKGIQELHFLSHDANWSGMQTACAAAGLNTVSLTQMRQFWKLYQPGLSESVGQYLGWLPYPVWTGTELGAGTVWIYDLEGMADNENASSSDTGAHTMRQALGIKRA